MSDTKILLIDDEEMIYEIILNTFKKQDIIFDYCKTYEEGIEKIDKEKYAIVIVDYELSKGRRGTEIIKYLKEKQINIPVVIVSGTDIERSIFLEEGAIAFVTKPFFGPELYYTILNILDLLAAYQGLEEAGSIIKALSSALDSRDSYTEGHSIRVLEFGLMLYDSLGYNDDEERSILKLGALLHDIGKIGIPDSILKSKKPLSDEEYEFIKKHPVIGYEICKNIKNLKPVLPIIRSHHEKIDGSGYPDGLSNNEIPHIVHIITIVDIFDALTTGRTYREPFTIEKAMETLYEEVEQRKLSKYFVDVFEKLVKDKTRKRVNI